MSHHAFLHADLLFKLLNNYSKPFLCYFLIGWTLGSRQQWRRIPPKSPQNQHTCIKNKFARQVQKLCSPVTNRFRWAVTPALATPPKLTQQSLVEVNLTYNQSLKLTAIHGIYKRPETFSFKIYQIHFPDAALPNKSTIFMSWSHWL
jgi:hypothetical protein